VNTRNFLEGVGKSEHNCVRIIYLETIVDRNIVYWILFLTCSDHYMSSLLVSALSAFREIFTHTILHAFLFSS
jgi:hypothetical protein